MRIILILTFVLSFLCTFGQSDYQSNVKTPKGDIIVAYITSESDNATRAYYDSYYHAIFPNATLINTYDNMSSTRRFNCHGYAWHRSEGGSDRWIGYSPGNTDEQDYWLKGSYIEVSSECYPGKVSWASGDHSAVTTANPGWFISKWNEYPLMLHRWDDSPYGSSNLKYYKLNFSISGPSVLCVNGGNGVYSLTNTPGGLITWNKSSNFTISGSNTGPTVLIAASSAGNGYVGASFTSGSGTILTVPIKNVLVGKPSFSSSVSGPSQLTPGLSAVYSITPAAGASSYSWQIPSGCYSSYCWHITSGQGTTAISVQAGAIGSGVVQVTASNACPGNDSRYMYVNVQDPNAPCDPLTLSISPNPSVGGDVVIDVIKPPCDPTLMSISEATVAITDNMGNIVYSKKHTGNKVTISGLNLIQGVYHVVYTQNNKRFEKSMIVQ